MMMMMMMMIVMMMMSMLMRSMAIMPETGGPIASERGAVNDINSVEGEGPDHDYHDYDDHDHGDCDDHVMGGGRSPRQGRQITLELRRPKLGANKSSFADVEKYLIDNV